MNEKLISELQRSKKYIEEKFYQMDTLKNTLTRPIDEGINRIAELETKLAKIQKVVEDWTLKRIMPNTPLNFQAVEAMQLIGDILEGNDE
jgi:peptidoglycan hydrolase CwlO-like protein